MDHSDYGITKVTRSSRPFRDDGRHRFEHWLRDNQVYFITSTTRGHFPAFAAEEAKRVFWDRFDHYTKAHGFTPWISSLMNTHYHTLGYLRTGAELPKMVQRLHGSVAKLVNDLLPDRHLSFWRDARGKEYFDGCIRDEVQARHAYRYTLLQPVRAGIVSDWRNYPHVRVSVECERAIQRAHELEAFLEGVPYKRYDDPDGPAR